MDGILLINKPAGMTSHDVVNCIRRLLHTKKVGHCGTLDPDATGVLVLCIGKATKALQFLTSEEKEYIATLSLGKSTDTYDASGTVLETKEFQGVDHVEEVLLSFLGAQKQMPPIYSAIKVNGKKLYEYARNGEDVHIEPRDIEKGYFHLLSLEEAFAHFEKYEVEDENIVIHGKTIKSDIDHQVVVVNHEGKVLAVYGPDGKGYLKSVRGLF